MTLSTVSGFLVTKVTSTDISTDQLEASEVKPLTKADMVEFYKTYISPSSPHRARISVHLHAQGAGELDTKVIKVLKGAGLLDVPPEQRQSLDLLEKHIKEKTPLEEDKIASIMSDLKEAGLTQAAPEEDLDETPGDIAHGSNAINEATEIKDLRRFKAGLMTSSGAHPVKDISEYWDPDSKL